MTPYDEANLEAMEWALDIYSPMGEFIKTITHATSPNPIRGSPVAVVGECGRTLELRFNVRQDLMAAAGGPDKEAILPRQIVRYRAAPTSTLVAIGVVVVCPRIDSPGAGPADRDRDALERVSCVGLEQLLRESVVGPVVFDTPTDVSTIAYELCRRYAHPALVVQPEMFPASGFVLASYYSPYLDLYTALEELTSKLPDGGCFRVGADPLLNIIWEPAENEIIPM